MNCFRRQELRARKEITWAILEGKINSSLDDFPL
ncbi:MAG: hypothetical protein K1000chlam2_01004 [Chlamydiae bacterium]|nr:hypothetical protein [Chlamydiota bacterium]